MILGPIPNHSQNGETSERLERWVLDCCWGCCLMRWIYIHLNCLCDLHERQTKQEESFSGTHIAKHLQTSHFFYWIILFIFKGLRDSEQKPICCIGSQTWKFPTFLMFGSWLLWTGRQSSSSLWWWPIAAAQTHWRLGSREDFLVKVPSSILFMGCFPCPWIFEEASLQLPGENTRLVFIRMVTWYYLFGLLVEHAWFPECPWCQAHV